jgi:hypothetical protein
MARQLETFAGVRDGRAIDFEDGYVLVKIVADQQIFSVGRERRPFRHAAASLPEQSLGSIAQFLDQAVGTA